MSTLLKLLLIFSPHVSPAHRKSQHRDGCFTAWHIKKPYKLNRVKPQTWINGAPQWLGPGVFWSVGGGGGSPDALAKVTGTLQEWTSLSETVEKWVNNGVKQLSLPSVRLKNLGTILTRLRFPSATRNFSPSHLLVQTLTVLVQPLRAITCTNICAHVKTPKHWQPYHCFDTQKYYTHW